MKRMKMLLFLVLCGVLLGSQAVYANMAAPDDPDVGSSITFQKNDALSVTSEVLDIEVHGATADITAIYTMENTTGEAVSTPVMFLSPKVEEGGTTVTADGEALAFTVERYVLRYNTTVQTEDWRYAVLSEAEAEEGQTVDSVSFTMDFAPRETREIAVSYTYRLGGYPDYDFDVKDGRIEYYLAPAALWKDFQDLTINLYLDEGMPVIRDSSVEFEEVGTRIYQYVSHTLPEGNLIITIDESRFQEIFSSLRSPYLWMGVMMFLPVLVPLLLIILAVVIWRVRKKRKANKLEP